MKDAFAQDLKVGDIVLVPMRVDAIKEAVKSNNVTMTTIAPDSPNGLHSTVTITSTQVIRANDGDDTAFDPSQENKLARP